MTVDEYLEERTEQQDELFRKVVPMAGAVKLVQYFVGLLSRVLPRGRWRIVLMELA